MEIEKNCNQSMHFNEAAWLKLVFLLADTQAWVDDLAKEALRRIPIPDKKKFLRKSYYLSISTLAHIPERHYYKINRYPHAGKFHISPIEILHQIREAYSIQPASLKGSQNFYRIKEASKPVGFDKYGQPTNIITILTDAGGRIITAYPGGSKLMNGE